MKSNRKTHPPVILELGLLLGRKMVVLILRHQFVHASQIPAIKPNAQEGFCRWRGEIIILRPDQAGQNSRFACVAETPISVAIRVHPLENL